MKKSRNASMCHVACSLKNVSVVNTAFRYRALSSPNSIQSLKLALISLVKEGTPLSIAQFCRKEKTMEEKNRVWCGIDVSKDTITAALDLSPELPVRKMPVRTFMRTLDGLQDMMDWCRLHKADAIHVHMEATGIYSRDLLMWFQLHYPTVPVSVGNPRSIKHFIDSEHLGNKTDELDAMAIARMGTVQRPEATPPSPPEYLQLRELIRSRDDLVVKMRALEVSRKAMQDLDSVSAKFFQTVIKTMQKAIGAIEDAILDLRSRVPEIKKSVELMCSMPGIGILASCTILAELGPFSPDHTRSEFSGYTGLQPAQRQSGTSVNSSHLSKNGSPLLRKILYLCSIHSVGKVPSLQAQYSRLLMKGKKPLTARCACMRKMLLILRSMVLNNMKFDANYMGAQKKEGNGEKAS